MRVPLVELGNNVTELRTELPSAAEREPVTILAPSMSAGSSGERHFAASSISANKVSRSSANSRLATATEMGPSTAVATSGAALTVYAECFAARCTEGGGLAMSRRSTDATIRI